MGSTDLQPSNESRQLQEKKRPAVRLGSSVTGGKGVGERAGTEQDPRKKEQGHKHMLQKDAEMLSGGLGRRKRLDISWEASNDTMQHTRGYKRVVSPNTLRGAAISGECKFGR